MEEHLSLNFTSISAYNDFKLIWTFAEIGCVLFNYNINWIFPVLTPTFPGGK